jgi:hypothetical protein
MHKIISDAVGLKQKIFIVTNNRDDDLYKRGLLGQYVIRWDPHSGLLTKEGGRQSPALGVGHELDHAVKDIEDPKGFREGRSHFDRDYDNLEERRVIRGSEAHAAKTLGEAQRYDHNQSTTFRTGSPTSTTPSSSSSQSTKLVFPIESHIPMRLTLTQTHPQNE